MPFWYALVLILLGIEIYLRLNRFLLTATLLWAAAIVYTVLGPVPIKNHIASWRLQALPPQWRADRTRWDQLHRWRVLLLLIAPASAVFGLLY